jgi:cell division protein FtsW (lipid II flippase)
LVATIILTGSRTALISLVASTIWLSGVAIFVQRAKPSWLSVFVSVLLLSIVLMVYRSIGVDSPETLYENTDRFSSENIETLEYRIQHWLRIFDLFSGAAYEYIFGLGPSKANSIIFGDNMYILFFRDFGLFGLACYLTLLATMHIRLLKIARTGDEQSSSLAVCASGILISLNVFDLAADGWFYVRITPWVLVMYGMTLYSYQNRGRRRESVYHHSELERGHKRLSRGFNLS